MGVRRRTVLVAATDLGDILTDDDGNTTTSSRRHEGVSNCAGECLATGRVEADDEPVAGDGVDAELGTIERDDGTVQLTRERLPGLLLRGR